MFQFELLPEERLIRQYRQSEWIMVKPVLAVFLAVYAPWYLLISYGLQVEYRSYLLVWTLLVFAYCAYEWFLWAQTQYILTDRRLGVVLYKNLFQKIVLETPLDRIANVSFGTRTPLQALLGYGDVYVQVMGIQDPFVLANVKNPSRLKDLLWKVHQAAGGLANNSLLRTD